MHGVLFFYVFAICLLDTNSATTASFHFQRYSDGFTGTLFFSGIPEARNSRANLISRQIAALRESQPRCQGNPVKADVLSEHPF